MLNKVTNPPSKPFSKRKALKPVLTLWLPARVEYLQVEGLSTRLLDDSDVAPGPLIGSRQSVRPPIRPVDAASKERHGEGVGKIFVAPEDLDDPTSIVECRENGVGAVQKRPTQRAISKFKPLFKCIEREQ